MDSARIALFFGNFHGGGIQRVRLNLARGFLSHGFDVDFVVVKGDGELRDQVPPGVNVVDLDAERALFALPALIRYLRSAQPAVVLSSQTHHNIVAIVASALSGMSTRLVVGEHNNWLQMIHYAVLSDKIGIKIARIFYQKTDAILAVSKGAADAFSEISGVQRDRIHVIYNPISITKIQSMAQITPDHPWLLEKKHPVVLAAGRLNRQKDFPTLLRAIASLLGEKPVRLIVLGEGEERLMLEEMINRYGLEKFVDMPGFKENPYTYMANADVFVLSSAWEGFPNALLEALACGTPVVSTDCPSGPSEMLDNGRYGGLVPVGDYETLARTIAETLNNPLPRNFLLRRASEYSIDTISEQYLELLLGEGSRL